ncbi:MAG: hypothetical protein CL760_09245 [Chloroflexi bacterium]|nr:hypothetical protein [Chloroflexota bacterium]|tara:strand:- start:17002 stop:17421 length:420 start_codon:yes stop_codon:yes gene_type:complete
MIKDKLNAMPYIGGHTGFVANFETMTNKDIDVYLAYLLGEINADQLINGVTVTRYTESETEAYKLIHENSIAIIPIKENGYRAAKMEFNDSEEMEYVSGYKSCSENDLVPIVSGLKTLCRVLEIEELEKAINLFETLQK